MVGGGFWSPFSRRPEAAAGGLMLRASVASCDERLVLGLVDQMSMTRRSPVATERGVILAGLCLLAIVAGGAATVFDGFLAPGAEENDKSQAVPRARARVALRDGLSVITLDASLRQRAGIIIAAISPAPTDKSVFA